MKHHISKKGMSLTEWRKVRKNFFGSSDAPPLLNLTPKWRTKYDLWLDKTNPDAVEQEDNLRMWYGREVEPIIAKRYALETKHKVRNDFKIRVHPEIPYLAANLDRVITPNEQDIAEGRTGLGILECKEVDSLTKGSWQNEFPDYYFVQVQHQLLVTGFQWAVLALKIGNRQFLPFLILPNEDVFNLIKEEATKLWYCVENKIEPEMTAKDYEKILPLTGSVAEAQGNILVDHASALQAKTRRDSMKTLYEEITDRIKEFMGTNEVLSYKGKILATWKLMKERKEFDEDKFAEENPKLYNQYLLTKPSTRRFSLKEAEVDYATDTTIPEVADKERPKATAVAG